jgi:6-phosphogluconolactonase
MFWGEERYVPADDPLSNYRMTREALLSHVPIPVANVHPAPTSWPTPRRRRRPMTRSCEDFLAQLSRSSM